MNNGFSNGNLSRNINIYTLLSCLIIHNWFFIDSLSIYRSVNNFSSFNWRLDNLLSDDRLLSDGLCNNWLTDYFSGYNRFTFNWLCLGDHRLWIVSLADLIAHINCLWSLPGLCETIKATWTWAWIKIGFTTLLKTLTTALETLWKCTTVWCTLHGERRISIIVGEWWISVITGEAISRLNHLKACIWISWVLKYLTGAGWRIFSIHTWITSRLWMRHVHVVIEF